MRSKITLPSEKIVGFCRNHRILELSLFGSVLQDAFGPDSDVDVLVSFDPEAQPDLMDLIGMRDELSGILGREVDMVEKEALQNPFLRRSILGNIETVYAA